MADGKFCFFNELIKILFLLCPTMGGVSYSTIMQNIRLYGSPCFRLILDKIRLFQY